MEAAAPSAIQRAASQANEGTVPVLIGVPSCSHVLHDHNYARCVQVFKEAFGNILSNDSYFFYQLTRSYQLILPLATRLEPEPDTMGTAAPSAIEQAASQETEGTVADLIEVPSCSHVLHDHNYARCVQAALAAIQQAAGQENEGTIADLLGVPSCSHVQLDFGCAPCVAFILAKLGTGGELVPLTLEAIDFGEFPEEENRSCDHVAFNPEFW